MTHSCSPTLLKCRVKHYTSPGKSQNLKHPVPSIKWLLLHHIVKCFKCIRYCLSSILCVKAFQFLMVGGYDMVMVFLKKMNQSLLTFVGECQKIMTRTLRAFSFSKEKGGSNGGRGFKGRTRKKGCRGICDRDIN